MALNRNGNRTHIFFWSLITFFFVGEVWAGAYKADDVLRAWGERTKKIKSVYAKLETSRANAQSSTEVLVEEVWIQRPGEIRRRIQSGPNTLEYLLTPQKAVEIQNGKSKVVAPSEALGPVGLFYMTAGARMLAAYLRQTEISLSEPHWALIGSDVVYELGDSKGPNVRFDKYQFIPRGVSLRGTDFRFMYGDGIENSAFPFPQKIESYQGETHLQSSVVRVIQADRTFPKNHFHLDTILMSSRSAAKP